MVDCQRREKPVRRGDRRRGRLVILEAGPADRSRAHGACDCKKRRDKGQFTRILTRPALSEVAFNVVSRGTAYGPKTDVFGARSSNIVENRWGTLTLNGMLEVRGREGQQWKELTYQGKLQRTCASSFEEAEAGCSPMLSVGYPAGAAQAWLVCSNLHLLDRRWNRWCLQLLFPYRGTVQRMPGGAS
jgi:hypothetical protein